MFGYFHISCICETEKKVIFGVLIGNANKSYNSSFPHEF